MSSILFYSGFLLGVIAGAASVMVWLYFVSKNINKDD
jgi:hypothetical protein